MEHVPVSATPESMGGENLAFAESLYEQYLQDPSSLDPKWQALFEPMRDRKAGPLGPTFQPRSIFAGGGANGHGNGNGKGAAAVADGGATAATLRQERVDRLVQAFRAFGHLEAKLDPLGSPRPEVPELHPTFHGLTDADLDRPSASRAARIAHAGTLRELIEHLRATYCRTIGVQFAHIENGEARRWLEERMEATQNRLKLSREQQVKILTKLTDAEQFEQFIQKKFLGAKSFSLEGGESLIPMLDLAIERASEHGVDQIIIGMAHRGRLNVLANILGKSPRQIFREFEDKDPDLYWGRGDVKYHLGRRVQVKTEAGRQVELTLCFNPSHLEFVGPVVEGRVRARQDERPANETSNVMPLVLHGDAAFAGQGIVQELLNMAGLPGYATGGTVHIVVNNQIGFTTPASSARSTRYATDVATMLDIPVFHVNGEDPEAVVAVAHMALDWRARFAKDVVIDLYCYRKHGHNEGDEPAYTQPVMYRAIRARRTVRESYVEHLSLSREQADRIVEERRAHLEAELSVARQPDFKREKQPTQIGGWERMKGGPVAHITPADTRVAKDALQRLLLKLNELPPGFEPHNKLDGFFKGRAAMAKGERALDWSAAEALAFATLLVEGHPVRISGQDSGRGTFSHRHAVLHEVNTGSRHLPLQHVAEKQASFTVWDSPLSEAGVLAFDWGYSLERPEGLVCWEAQFGDFVNGAQVIIDQFIASAEDKWNLLSSLVMLLPHGFEGQGPEHSSARIERFLQLAAEDNIQILNPTTPANMFHALRRQVLSPWKKPLVVMTPKSLLRLPACVSSLEDLSERGFLPVIPDAEVKDGKRVLLVCGRLYYDLVEARAQRKRQDVAIIRIEQPYPLDEKALQAALEAHPFAPVVWVQDDPRNMGGWSFMRARFGESILGRPLSCVSREESASPATGSLASHKREQELLIQQAFGEE